MHPTQTLMDEHQRILQVLDALDAVAAAADREGTIPADAADVTWFLREYADRLHHGKEEDRLFPAMVACGFAEEGGPIPVMRWEHDQGRALVGEMIEAVAGRRSATDFAVAAGRFTALLRQHIEKEDHCLFPMAEQALGPEGLEQMEHEFSDWDEDEVNRQRRQRGREVAERLTAAWCRTPVSA